MILDNQLLFSNLQSLITAATGTPSTTVIDLTGGVAMNIGLMTRFGEDLGTGPGLSAPRVVAFVGTAFTTTNSATLMTQFQGSTDSTTWTTYMETPAYAAAALVAGFKIADFAWPVVPQGVALPRYVRLNYVLPGSTSFTAGTIFASVSLATDQQNYYGPAYSAA